MLTLAAATNMKPTPTILGKEEFNGKILGLLTELSEPHFPGFLSIGSQGLDVTRVLHCSFSQNSPHDGGCVTCKCGVNYTTLHQKGKTMYFQQNLGKGL